MARSTKGVGLMLLPVVSPSESAPPDEDQGYGGSVTKPALEVAGDMAEPERETTKQITQFPQIKKKSVRCGKELAIQGSIEKMADEP